MTSSDAGRSGDPSTSGPRSRRTGPWLIGLAAGAWVTSRFAVLPMDAFHWDEFALLRVAARTSETGLLMGGGRPGLVTLLLLPIVEHCTDEIAVLQQTRALWVVLTTAALAAFAALLTLARDRGPHRAGDVALAIGLVALLPAFLTSSIQVRTDQVAIAAGLWGGVALLASRKDPRLALLAGVGFGVGFLASQKLLYVAALVGWLAFGDWMRRRERRLQPDLQRAVFVVAAAGAVIAGFHALTSTLLETNRSLSASDLGRSLGDQLDMFAFYRHTIGWDQYAAVWPTLLPHVAVFLLLGAASSLRLARGQELGWSLLTGWGCLVLGLAVAWLHASAFLYFWMVLALFPAAAAGVSLGAIREALAPAAPRTFRLLPALLWLALAGPALLAVSNQLVDTQATQRSSVAFVHRNFAPTDAGFQPEGVLFCGGPQRDFGIFFGYQLYSWFGGDELHRRQNIERLLREFSDREVKFLVGSWRFRQFPEEIRRFWSEHFQPYKDSVYVAGRRFEPQAGATRRFELLVGGEYRWMAPPGSAPVQLDGRPVRPGQSVRIAAGPHRLVFGDDQPQAFLILALDEGPGPALRPFYERYR